MERQDPDASRTSEVAEAFEQLFADVYLRFHRRDAQHAELTGASRAVLLHLAMTGPLPIGEAALHLGRAQSVVSEIVDQLEGHGLLERERDPADRRRVLVWLTPAGQQRLRRDRQVLSAELLQQAFRGLPAEQATALLTSLQLLLDAAPATVVPHPDHSPTDQGEPA